MTMAPGYGYDYDPRDYEEWCDWNDPDVAEGADLPISRLSALHGDFLSALAGVRRHVHTADL